MATFLSGEGEAKQSAIVRDVDELMRWHQGQLEPAWNDMIRWWQLYLAKQRDQRDPVTEKWRANVFVPYPYSGVETKVAVLTDIINSASPLIQAEGVDDQDMQHQDSIERLLDYTLTRNNFRSKLDLWLRECAIQGVMAFKTLFLSKTSQFQSAPTASELTEFQAKLGQAFQLLGPNRGGFVSPAEDPEGFEAWRQTFNASSYGTSVKVPSAPGSGSKEVIRFRGPWFERISMFDVFLDPNIYDVQEQDQIVHRTIKPQAWLEQRAKAGLYDPAAVELGLKAGGGDLKVSQFDQDIQQMLNIQRESERNPRYNKACEILEVFRPHDDVKYMVVLNRKAIINKNPRQMPFVDQQVPITLLRNSPVPGRAFGISELQEPESLYYEMQSLRNLRLDALTLATLPIFTKLRELGLPELKRLLRPGVIIDVVNQQAIQQLVKVQIPPESFREMFEIKQDIDETNATPAQVRGNPSTVGRVSATESERRFSQALVRIKQAVARLEDELQPAVVLQSLARWYQFGSEKERVDITGGEDPFIEVTRNDLISALSRNYRFRGATRSLNRDMQAQQLQAFAKEFGMNLSPREMRSLMKLLFETLGLRGSSMIITEEVTVMAQKSWEMKQQLEMAQLQAQGGGAAGPAAMALPGQKSPAETQAADAEMAAQASPPGPTAPGAVVAPQDVGQEVQNSLAEGQGLGVNSGQAPGQMPPPPPGPPA